MKTVIITGGSSGIGQACVNKFLKDGKHYVYNFDIKKGVDINHEHYTFVMTDMTNNDSVTSSVQKVIDERSRIDVLIPSAGKHLSANIEKTSYEEALKLFQLNVFGVFSIIQSVIEVMKYHQQGRIITIGSDQCQIAKSNSTVYGMTKSAILSLTKSIALDYAQYGIRANCIGAGTIDTPLYRSAISAYAKKTHRQLNNVEKSEAEKQPIGRIGLPEEVAELAFFLSTPAADYITGSLIPIDGGYTAQ